MTDGATGPGGLREARWGPVFIGMAAGLFFLFVTALAVWLITALIGIAQSDLGPAIVLAFAFFSGLLFSGYVAGRFTADTNPGFHGNLAGLLLYAVVAVLSLVAGSPAEAPTLILFALVAAIIGYAGGVLGGRPRPTR